MRCTLLIPELVTYWIGKTVWTILFVETPFWFYYEHSALWGRTLSACHILTWQPFLIFLFFSKRLHMCQISCAPPSLITPQLFNRIQVWSLAEGFRNIIPLLTKLPFWWSGCLILVVLQNEFHFQLPPEALKFSTYMNYLVHNDPSNAFQLCSKIQLKKPNLPKAWYYYHHASSWVWCSFGNIVLFLYILLEILGKKSNTSEQKHTFTPPFCIVFFTLFLGG